MFEDASTARAALDDVLDEATATAGELNLLVDAIRLGGIPNLARVLASGADMDAALAITGARLATERGGGDPRAAAWACAALGYAVGVVPESIVVGYGRPLAEARPTAPVTLAPTPIGSPAGAAVTLPAFRHRERESPRRERAWAGAAAVAVVIAISAGLGVGTAYLLTSDRDDDRVPAEILESSGVTADTGQGGTASTPTDIISPPAEGAERSDVLGRSAHVSCWDGGSVRGLAACSFPHELPGLHWVFPDSDRRECASIARGLHGRVLDRYCRVALPSGRTAQFHYSQWKDFDAMVANYRADQAAADLALSREDLHAFAVADVDAPYKVALYYRLPDAPWSVTVYATSETDLDQALHLLRIRPIKHLRGIGRQQQHVPTSSRVMP